MDSAIQNAIRHATETNSWEDWQNAARSLYRVGRFQEATNMLSRVSAEWRTRNDTHRPSQISPDEYSFVMSVPTGPFFSEWQRLEMVKMAELRRTQPFFVKESGKGQCDICGAWFIHGAVYNHKPTNDHIIIGWICASKMDLMCDFSRKAQKQSMDSYIRMSNARKVWRALRAAYAELPKDVRRALRVDHKITKDIRNRFRQWRNMSQAQMNLLLKLEDQVNNPKEEEKHVSAPVGRQEITGQVISLKWKSTDFGDCLKMTVKIVTPEGSWLCWGSVPKALDSGKVEVEIKDTVKFTGTLKRGSQSHFAFFSRPSKASVVTKGN